MVKMPQMSQRDRMALIVGGIVVLATLIVFGIILPYQAAMAKLDGEITRRQKEIQEVQGLQQEYQLLQRQLAQAENRLTQTKGFSLFSFIETVTSRVATTENLVYMRPQQVSAQEGYQEESVEVKLEKLRLDQLIQFLYAIQSADAYLQVKTLRVRTRFDDPSLLDATMTVSAFGKKS